LECGGENMSRVRGRSPEQKLDPVACRILAGFAAYLMAIVAVAWALAWAPPDTTFRLHGHILGPADVAHRLLRRGLLLGLLLPALLAIELALEGWQESSLRRLIAQRPRSACSDIAVFLFWCAPGHTFIAAALSLGVVLLPAQWLHHALADATGLSIELGARPLAAQVLVLVIVYSFFDYWQHRLDHTAWFWPLHRYHHSAEDFCILTSVRVHPASITAIIAGVLPAVLIGVQEEALFWLATLIAALRYLIHARINSDFGWIGRWVIQSPLHHRLHHKLDTTHPASHFGLTPVWDRMFGTWADQADLHVPIGVAAPYRQGVWVVPDLLRDYRDFWLALIGRYRDGSGAVPPVRQA
jgi:sterol desaturase/sphingolipid hydroxylase (fatty acid hydroxylase superfamily)